MGLDVTWAVKWLTLSAQAMAEHRVELIELDRAIGDSDHGENMDRGFQAVLDKLAESPPETPGAALKLTAMALMSKVGGAAGPLYGTAFLRAATTLGDAANVDAAALAAALAAARDGIVARGKAEAGDKTMVDAWTPAVDAAAAAAADGDTLARSSLLRRRPPRLAPWPPIRWWRARAGPATSGSAAPGTATPEQPRVPSFSAPLPEPPHDGADRGGFAQ